MFLAYFILFLFFFYSLFFFFKQKTAYEISACLVGSEMCIRDSSHMFVKLQCLVVTVHIQFHQTRAGMHFLDVLDGFAKEETAAMCTLVIGEYICLLYTSPSPRDRQKSRMPSSA